MKCPTCGSTLVDAGNIDDLNVAAKIKQRFPNWSIRNPVLHCEQCDQTELRSTWQRFVNDNRGLPKGDR